MESLLKKYIKGDTTLWIVFILLCVISIIEMYSASSTLAYKASSHTAPIFKHAMFLLAGGIVAFSVQFIDYKYVRLFGYTLWAFSIVTLIYVLLFGKSENDATRWVAIGGIQFQPSELGKLAVIIVGADLISRIKNPQTDEKMYFILTLVSAGIVSFLILLENFSTAFLLLMVIYIMMFIGRVSFKRLFSIVGILFAVLVFGYLLVDNFGERTTIREDGVVEISKGNLPSMFDRAQTWKNRVDRFFVTEETEVSKYQINDTNRQVQHAKIAIARGGILGVFPGNSVERDYLPQAYSDFIFAIILEEGGLLLGIVVIGLYLILLYRAGNIASKCSTVFPALLAIGLSLMIVFQAFINILVATNLIPVTGQPLPLISRGGTSILITCVYFGLIFGVIRQEKRNKDLVEEPEKLEDSNLVELDEL